MKNQTNPAIDSFIIEAALITPIQKIVDTLQAKQYRDCDIKWLDAKLENYVKLAAETLFIKGLIMPEKTNFPLLNEYVYNYYTEKFTNLLTYFKSF